MTGQCLCGAVSVSIDASPAFINDCNCSLCRKSGGAWGYFSCAAVRTTGDTVPFVRRDKSVAGVAVHSCKSCATTTHWTLTEAFKAQHGPVDRMGVNMKLFSPDELNGIEVRFPNGHDWPGEGEFGYRRPAIVIGSGEFW